jgi:hypothetical protein
MKFSLLLGLVLVPLFLFSQSYQPANDLPVYNLQGDSLAHAWSGGMNNPQLSSTDINLDGEKDLVIFDRMDNSFTVYLNRGTANQVDYVLAPQFKSTFKDCDCSTWTLLEDFNCDGREDIFCGNESGQVLVYEQKIFGDSVGFVAAYEPLTSLYTNRIPLSIPKTDVPALIDMDGDGDLDILAPQNVFTTLAFHRNMAMEEDGNCDSLKFVRESACWGYFIESSTDNTLAIGDTIQCPLPPGVDRNCIPDFRRVKVGQDLYAIQASPRHAGTTLLALDLDGNGLKDVMIGDISFPSVTTAFNGGCPDFAFMDSVETFYPQTDSAIDVPVFPAMFWQDLDNDNKKDLIVAPNEIADGENVNGLIWYRNQGNNVVPDFRFQGRTLIVNEQIDIGTFSAPAFFDYDEDGLPDLMVGHAFARYKTEGNSEIRYELRLYRNTGTLEEPAFTLADTNFLNFFQSAPPVEFCLSCRRRPGQRRRRRHFAGLPTRQNRLL